MSRARLTAKQQRFISEYLVDGNATQAAIRAGYSPRTAGFIAHENLRKPNISRLIEERQAATAATLLVTSQRIAAELALMAFANMADYIGITGAGTPYVDLGRMTRAQAAAVVEITVDEYTEGRGDEARNVRRVKFKLGDKRAALVDLAKLLGYWRDKAEVEAGSSLLAALESIEAKRKARPDGGEAGGPKPAEVAAPIEQRGDALVV